MGIGNMLSNLIIGPLKLLFEVIFALANRVLPAGLSIVALSLVVNVLVLPLYRRADAVQEEERETEKRLNPGIRHIRETFTGDEQYMMLQTYYRQNHYSPLHALKGAIPLLLEIPFFIAAYQFLSRLGSLQGASLGPIRDLGQPDQLLVLGGLSINLLPILMTVVNLLSSALYTKGAPLKSKLQLLGMALVFLVLLYSSPAGLTFYWTLNNVFSLVKNLLQKLFPKRQRAPREPWKALRGPARPGMFVLCALLLTLLTGLLIPSAVLVASPEEFIAYPSEPNPVWYAVNALLLAAGTFMLWGGMYYALGSKPMKRGLEIGAWVLSGIFLVNYLFFRNNLSTISSTLVYEVTPEFTITQKLVNLGILALTAAVFLLAAVKKENLVRGLALTMALAMGGMSVWNLRTVASESNRALQAQARNYQGPVEIPLSRDGKNVVVLMLDRAVSSYIPVMFYEKPELKESYSGFVYYPNTLSFGAHTNFGVPAIYGGYEYSAKKINERNTETLRDKQNEALLMMPTLFSEKGYQITVFDAPYPGNYTTAGDYTVYDYLPNTNARALVGSAEVMGKWERFENIRLRNFFCYSLSMVVPSALYGTVYNMGYYNRAEGSASLFSLKGDPPDAEYSNMERDMYFLMEYEALDRMKDITVISDNPAGTLLLMDNCTTHEPTVLKEPEYVPARNPDNAAYDAGHQDRFFAGPIPLSANTDYQMAHYEINMAGIRLVAEWLDYLKEIGVYDNTRIIVVSDHGWELNQIGEGIMTIGDYDLGYNPLGDKADIMEYNPVLLVKDFGAEGEPRTDTTFMTNADVPTIAMADLIENPVNPFTGNPVNSDAKQETQYVIASHMSDSGVEKGLTTTFVPAPWFAVEPGGDTLFDQSRWTFLPERK